MTRTGRYVVVKVGSSSLTSADGRLDRSRFLPLAQSVCDAQSAGYDVIIVTSGAVAAGIGKLNLPARPKLLPQRQAVAAVGQGYVIQTWAEAFAWYNLSVGQLLLTRHDLSVRESYDNVLACLEALLDDGVVPIINENDSVRVRKSNFGDNDMLAALVAALIQAEQLIIFTDIAGLYDSDPRKNPAAKRFDKILDITPSLLEAAEGSGSSVGTGGMRSKLEAVSRAIHLGVPSFIGKAHPNNAVRAVLEGNGDGTYLGGDDLAAMSRKKQWILFHSEFAGCVVIDDGARNAMTAQGRSLLPVGIKSVDGEFKAGQVIDVRDSLGELVGRGVSQYSSELLRKVQGQSTEYAKTTLGVEKPEVIHRDSWVSWTE